MYHFASKTQNLSNGVFRHLVQNFKNHVTCMRKSAHFQNAQLIEGTNAATSVSHTIGQPSPNTHPHLLKKNELVPGFTLGDFIKRRERLIEKVISSKPKSSHVILIPSASTQYMTDKIPYVFRQNTDFRYLTGCLEPDSALLIIVKPEGKYESTLFVRDKNAHTELWEGPRTGVQAAAKVFGVDIAKSFSTLDKELKEITKQEKSFTFWYDFRNPVHKVVHQSVVGLINSSSSNPSLNVDYVTNLIHELRLIKTEKEQDLMQASAKIASDAINNTVIKSEPGQTEHQLFAMVDYYCRMKGAEFLAYPPVIAAGNNANIIHYINNNQMIFDGDLILMDAGCELHGYCSDITRTWPVNGKFTPEQRTLYEIVLHVQTELIKMCSEECSLDDIFKEMCILLGKHLKEAHVLSKETDKLSLQEVVFKLCPHHVGHYLGMDVHDVGTINRQTRLKNGMVITIEPGGYENSIYADQRSKLVKSEFRGLGIRIEDDVLMCDGKAKVLSTSPKSVYEIEELCQR